MKLPRGVGAALLAALLFGLSTPLAKLLLGGLPPLLLAGLLYLGSGIGLTTIHVGRRLGGVRTARLARSDMPWLAGAVATGGLLGPVLLMVGLARTPASAAALMLNLEGVFTALLAWFVFRENFDRRIALGMAFIVSGGLVLSWPGTPGVALPAGALAVAGACLCWAIDNNLTQKVAAADPLLLAAVKGMAAGVVNTGLGLWRWEATPSVSGVAWAMLLGLGGYGLSLALFVVALRHLGTARTGAYFSMAPFMGAIASVVVLHEPVTAALAAAGVLMGIGAWLHLSERHEHEHEHDALAHSHRHVHDAHHRHEHEPGTEAGQPHTHWHVHEPLVHKHPHYPDLHHRHRH